MFEMPIHFTLPPTRTCIFIVCLQYACEYVHGDCTEHSSELALSVGGEIEISNLEEGGKLTVVVVISMPVDSLIPRSCWKKIHYSHMAWEPG